MICFPAGINISQGESECFCHIQSESFDGWLRKELEAKASDCQRILIRKWLPTLYQDSAVESIPKDEDALAAMIIARPDYLTFKQRLQVRVDREMEIFTRRAIPNQVPPQLPPLVRLNAYASKTRETTITICPNGVDVADSACACILDSEQSIENWIIGAILGRINKGTKAMLRQYRPIVVADKRVPALPGTEEELLSLITSRADYMTMPEQKAEIERRIRVEAEEKEAQRISEAERPLDASD